MSLLCVLPPLIEQVNSAESSTSDLGIVKVWVVPSTETLYFFLSLKLKGLPSFSQLAGALGLEASQVRVTVSPTTAETSFRGTVKSGEVSTKRFQIPNYERMK